MEDNYGCLQGGGCSVNFNLEGVLVENNYVLRVKSW